MPNYCENILDFSHINYTNDEFEKVVNMLTTYGEMDFRKMIAPPKEYLEVNIGAYTVKQYSRYYYENPDNLSQEQLDGIIGNTLHEIDGIGNISNRIDILYPENAIESYNGKLLADWYSWNNCVWGTKWNAFDTILECDSIWFTTAWSPITDRLFQSIVEKIMKVLGNRAYNLEYSAYEPGCDVRLTYKVSEYGEVLEYNKLNSTMSEAQCYEGDDEI